MRSPDAAKVKQSFTSADSGTAAFKRGDHVNEVLTGAGFSTTEESVILAVRKGIAYVDQGPGNDPTRYDASTGQYDGDGLGFSRRIERV